MLLRQEAGSRALRNIRFFVLRRELLLEVPVLI